MNKKSSTLSTGASLKSLYSTNISDLEGALKEKVKMISKLQEENQRIVELAQAEITDLKKKCKKYKNMARDFKSQSEQLSHSLERQESENREIKSNTEISSMDLEKFQHENEELKQELDRVRNLHLSKVEEIKELKEKVRDEESNRLELEVKVNEAAEEFKAKSPVMIRKREKKWEEVKVHLEDELRSKEDAIKKLKIDVEIEKKRKVELKNYSEQLRKDLDKLSIELTQKEDEMIQSEQSGSVSLEFKEKVKTLKKRFNVVKEENAELSVEFDQLLSFSSFLKTVSTAVIQNMEKSEKDKGDMNEMTDNILNIQIEELKQHHEREIEELKKKHEKIQGDLSSGVNSQIDELKQRHEKELDELKKEHEKNIGGLTSQVNSLKVNLVNEQKKSLKLSEDINKTREDRETSKADSKKKNVEYDELTQKYTLMEKEKTTLEERIRVMERASAEQLESMGFQETKKILELKRKLDESSSKLKDMETSEVGPLREKVENERKTNQSLRNKLKSTNDDLDASKKKIQILETQKIQPLQKDLQAEKAKNKKLVKERIEPLEAELKRTRESVSSVKARNESLTQEVKNDRTNLQNKSGSVARLERNLEEKKKESEQLKHENRRLSTKLDVLKQRSDTMKAQSMETVQRYEKMKKECESLKRKLEMSELKIKKKSSAQEKVQALEKQIKEERLKSRKSLDTILKNQHQIKSLTTENNNMKKQMERKEHEIEEIMHELEEIKSKSLEKGKIDDAEMNKRIDDVRGEIRKKKEMIGSLKKELKEAKRKNAKLVEEMKSEKENSQMRMEATHVEIENSVKESQRLEIKNQDMVVEINRLKELLNKTKSQARKLLKDKQDLQKKMVSDGNSRKNEEVERKNASNEQLRKLQIQIQNSKKVEAQLKTEISNLKSKLAETNKKNDQRVNELKEKMKKIIARKTSVFEEGEKKKNEEVGKLKQLNEKLTRLAKTRNAEIEKLKKSGVDVKELDSKKIGQLESTIQKLKKLVSSRTAETKKKTEELESVKVSFDKQKERGLKLERLCRQYKDRFTKSQKLGESLKRSNEDLKNEQDGNEELVKLKKVFENTKLENKQLRREYSKLVERLPKDYLEMSPEEQVKKEREKIRIKVEKEVKSRSEAMMKSYNDLTKKMETKENELKKRNVDLAEVNKRLRIEIKKIKREVEKNDLGSEESKKKADEMRRQELAKKQQVIQKLKGINQDLTKRIKLLEDGVRKKNMLIKRQQKQLTELRERNVEPQPKRAREPKMEEKGEEEEEGEEVSIEHKEMNFSRRKVGKTRKLELRIHRHNSEHIKLPEDETSDTIPQMVMDTISGIHVYIKTEAGKYKNSKGRYCELLSQCEREFKKLFHHVHVLTRKISKMNNPNNLYSMFFPGKKGDQNTISGFYSPYRGLFLVFLHEFFTLKQQCREKIYEEKFPHKRAQFITSLTRSMRMYSELFKACIISEEQNEKYPFTYSLKNVKFPDSFRKHFFGKIGQHYPLKIRQIIQTNLHIYASQYDLLLLSPSKKKNREENVQVPRYASLLGMVQELVPEDQRAVKNVKLFQEIKTKRSESGVPVWNFTDLPFGILRSPSIPQIKTSLPYQSYPPRPIPSGRVRRRRKKKSEEEEEGEGEELEIHSRKKVMSSLEVSMDQFSEYYNNFMDDYARMNIIMKHRQVLLNYKIIAPFDLPYGPDEFNGVAILHLHCGEKAQERFGRLVSKVTTSPVISVDYKKIVSPNLRKKRKKKTEKKKFVVPENNPETRKALLECFDLYRKVVEEGVMWFGKKVDRVVIIGDGMAGNLAASLALLTVWDPRTCPTLGGLALHYPSLQLGRDLKVLPSRFLSLIDPFLPYEVLESKNEMLLPKLKKKQHSSSNEEVLKRNMNEEVPVNPLISPLFAPNDLLSNFPPMYISVASVDPLFDEGVLFAKKVSRWSKEDVFLNVFDGMGHGFLNFSGVVPDSSREVMGVSRWIKDRIILKE